MLFLRATFCPSSSATKLCNKNRIDSCLDFLIGMVIFCVGGFFLIFSSVMLYDQMTSILTNKSEIEVLKKTEVQQRSTRENLEEAFGGRFGIFWFLPTTIKGSITRLVDVNQA